MGASNVVALFPAQSRFEDAWNAFPELGRRRSSRKEAGPEWAKAAKVIGEAELLAAVQRYAREDKDHRRECGPPAFHRWLKWGRYEHWLGVQDASAQGAVATFARDDIRKAILALAEPGWVRSYLDPCQVEGTTLVARTQTAIIELRRYGHVFKRHGLTGVRKAKENLSAAADR